MFIPLTVGGGVRTLDDARQLLRVGADKVSVNSAAVARPELIDELADKFGAQCVVVGIDVRRTGAAGLATASRCTPTAGGRPTGIDAIGWAAECERLGAGEIVLNSMDRDGTRDGFDLELTRLVVDTVGIPVVASGGVGRLEHLVEGATVGRRRRGAGRVDLPFRGGDRRRGQSPSARRGGGRAPARAG